MGRGFSKQSLHDTVFKKTNFKKTSQQQTEGLQQVNEEKFGHEKEKKQTEKQTEKVVSLFKKELKSVKDESKKTIKDEGPLPDSGAPRP